MPVNIVLLICELLVNGTHPSAVPASITASKQVRRLDEKAKEGEAVLEERSRRNWKKREEGDFASVHSNMQTPHSSEPSTLVGERLSVLVRASV